MTAATIKTCALCNSSQPLRISHIVPHFVFSSMKTGSLTGYLRSLDNPARRIQDGFKQELLCDACEQLFSTWESSVSRQVYLPITTGLQSVIRYGQEYSRFAISVLWRVLVWRFNAFISVAPQFKGNVENIEREWRAFLLGKERKPGAASCHTVILSKNLILGVGNVVGLTSDNFQRFLQRAVDVDVISDHRQPFVYAKLGRLLIFGLTPLEGNYRSSRVALQNGVLGPGKYQVPLPILKALTHNTERVFGAIEGLSDAQKQRINASINKNHAGRY
ncbi:hypothetical protein [uncultured Azohydromonas sp.]|jgi:hypothetical protein|uniref:hypothetical protein n=1 Tax=uncultured Azohydromonas sp. TaxID=487342 RepID=UPI002639E0C6|nr:hypothetical protein [uncultured Azohydromonas sp.]